MSKRGRQRKGVCVYCGQHGPITKDHVPPRSFFGDKLPQGINLITVPCCEECRYRYGKLDEKLKVLLTTVADPDENPIVRELWDDEGSIARGAKRPEAEGFRRRLPRAVVRVELQTPSGLYVGQTGGFRLGEVGVPEFVERTIRGLHHHERRERLPDDHDVRFLGTPTMLLRAYPEEQRRVVVGAMRRSLCVVHPHVFKYGHVAASDAPTSGFWFLKFYNTAEFAAATLPHDSWRAAVGKDTGSSEGTDPSGHQSG